MSIVITLPQAPEGPLIAAVALTDSGGLGDVTGISQVGATWQRAVQGGSGSERMEIWWSADSAGASQTVTINTVADENETAIVAEYNGVIEQSGTALDQTASASGNSSTADSGTTPTTTDPDEVWIAGIAVRTGASISAPTNSFLIDGTSSTGAGGTDVSATLLSRLVAAAGIANTTAAISGGPLDFGGAVATFFVQSPSAAAEKLGWGKDEWGTSPWGAAVPLAPLALDNARAISTKEVEVTLNRAPQAIAPTIPGDALNPATWVMQRLDTGAFFSVIAVRRTTSTTLVVTVLQDMGSVRVQHRILTTTLLDENGNPISNPPLNRFDFEGILDVEAKDALTRARRRSNAIRDIANPPVPVSGEISSIGGTFIINSGGDYELETGPSLVRKLIIRRLITPRGGFFHLPDYGLGLGTKELLPTSDLIQLRTEIFNQTLREPEVEDATVRLVLGAQNDLTVRVSARISSGELVDVAFQVTPEGVIL